MESNCGTCRFAFPMENGEYLCRRFPATPIVTEGHILAHFPRMHASGWCGEYKPRLQNASKS